jgi:hypothetical protein
VFETTRKVVRFYEVLVQKQSSFFFKLSQKKDVNDEADLVESRNKFFEQEVANCFGSTLISKAYLSG